MESKKTLPLQCFIFHEQQGPCGGCQLSCVARIDVKFVSYEMKELKASHRDNLLAGLVDGHHLEFGQLHVVR